MHAIATKITKKQADAMCDAIRSRVTEAGEFLLQYHEQEAWRAQGYTSFKDACAKEFEDLYGGRSQVYRLMEQARVMANVSPRGDTLLHTKITRELARLEPEEQREAYQEAVTEDCSAQPATSTVKKVVARKQAAKVPKAPAKAWATKPVYLGAQAALDRIGAVCGTDVSSSIKRGTLANVPPSEAIFWAALKDSDMQTIVELVVAKRWAPKKAHRFMDKMPDAKTRLGDLHLLAVAQGGVTLVNVAGFAAIVINTKKFPDEYTRAKKAFGL